MEFLQVRMIFQSPRPVDPWQVLIFLNAHAEGLGVRIFLLLRQAYVEIGFSRNHIVFVVQEDRIKIVTRYSTRLTLKRSHRIKLSIFSFECQEDWGCIVVDTEDN